MKISVLLSTRGRPGKLQLSIDSLWEKCHDKDNLEFCPGLRQEMPPGRRGGHEGAGGKASGRIPHRWPGCRCLDSVG